MWNPVIPHRTLSHTNEVIPHRTLFYIALSSTSHSLTHHTLFHIALPHTCMVSFHISRSHTHTKKTSNSRKYGGKCNMESGGRCERLRAEKLTKIHPHTPTHTPREPVHRPRETEGERERHTHIPGSHGHVRQRRLTPCSKQRVKRTVSPTVSSANSQISSRP